MRYKDIDYSSSYCIHLTGMVQSIAFFIMVDEIISKEKLSSDVFDFTIPHKTCLKNLTFQPKYLVLGNEVKLLVVMIWFVSFIMVRY